MGRSPPSKLELLDQIDAKNLAATPDDAEFLYRLAAHSDDFIEIDNNYTIRKTSPNKFKDNSLDWCMYLYGRVAGQQKYESRSLANSKRASLNSVFIGNKDLYAKLSKQGAAESRLRDPLYDKKRNKFCVEYYYSRGIFDPFEIEATMNELKAKCSLTKSQFIEKHGQDRWDDKVLKTRAALLSAPRRCASKEAMRYLREVVSHINVNFQDGDIWWFDSDRGEWWIKSDANYYFIDLCFPQYKIAVEYHGRFFHPKSFDDALYESSRWGSMPSAADKFEYDNKKRDAILKAGYTLFEVWSDELLPTDALAKDIENAIRFRKDEVVSAL